MELNILGGVNEYGRTCFNICSQSACILLDCGIMKGKNIDKQHKYPKLTEEIAQKLDFVFITHSHEDHWGALVLLYELGYKGKVYCTSHTKNQIIKMDSSGKIRELVDFVEIESVSSNNLFSLSENLIISWGPTGHLLGSVWFLVNLDNKKIFYSGDYCPESVLYNATIPKETDIDLAIIDNGYGDYNNSQKTQLESIKATVNTVISKSGKVFFPVPIFGRGQELIAFINDAFSHAIPIFIEKNIFNEFNLLINNSFYVKGQGVELIKSILSNSFIHVFDENTYDSIFVQNSAIVFISGGMMENDLSKIIVKKASQSDSMIFTGNLAKGTLGSKMLENTSEFKLNSILIRYNVHQGKNDADNLISQLVCKKVVLFHSKGVEQQHV